MSRWNGSRWRLQRTSTRHTPGAFLASVWCKSVTACIAVGNTSVGTLAERHHLERSYPRPIRRAPRVTSSTASPVPRCRPARVSETAFAPGGFPPQTLAERWNGVHWRVQPTLLLPGVGDLSNFSVACPAQAACIAAGGFENDGPGAKTLTARWRATGTPAAQVAPAVSLPRAYLGILGCVRAAIGEGLARAERRQRASGRFRAAVRAVSGSGWSQRPLVR